MASVLILDDHEDLLRVLAEAVALSGHQVLQARTGTEGLRLLESGAMPDVILCDIMMPDMNGIAFLQHVRAMPAYERVRFIVMSGNGGDRSAVLAAGANDYIAKPFSIPDLLHILESA